MEPSPEPYKVNHYISTTRIMARDLGVWISWLLMRLLIRGYQEVVSFALVHLVVV